MQYSIALLSFSLTVFCSAGAQDKQPPVKRKDSVTVSAGISQKQVDLEAKLGGILSDASDALRSGRMGDAVKEYESALAMVHQEPLLAEQQRRVLTEAGNSYIRANRPIDAIKVFQELVKTENGDCGSHPERCADAQMYLGNAEMTTGDFAGGLESFRQAEDGYTKAEKSGETHEYAMIQVMNLAKTKLLIAVALFQLGRSSDAVKTADDAISQLDLVKDDKSINVGIRESATSSLKDAQIILRRLKSAE